MANQIQVRRDSTTNWASSNPVLANGELGYDTDLKKIKVGDGSTAWASLSDLQAMGEWRDVVGAVSIPQTAVLNSTSQFGVPQSLIPAVLTNAQNSAAMIYLDPADYAVTGRTTQMRVVSFVQSGAGTPTSGTVTVALYPVSSTAANVVTVGSVTTGSSKTSGTISAANARTVITGDAFTAPTAGHYIVLFNHNAAQGSANQFYVYGWKLQVRVA